MHVSPEMTAVKAEVLKVLASPYLETASYNPYQLFLYRAMEEQGARVARFSTRKLLCEQWDVWHLHWPEHTVADRYSYGAVVALTKLWIKLEIARLKGTRVFWTAHNHWSHERNHPWLEPLLWKIFINRLAGIICMSEVGRRELYVAHPEVGTKRVEVISHGHYRGFYPDTVDLAQAREILNIDCGKTVIGFFGMIRPYKSVLQLIRCFRQAGLSNAVLLIVGKPHTEEYAAEIEQAARGADDIRLYLRFVADEEVQVFLRSSDLMVFPYREILNSGSALLALSFDVPVMVPAQGALLELSAIAGPQWVRLYEGELTPDALSKAVQWAEAGRRGRGERPAIDVLDWKEIGRKTLEAFQKRLSNSK